MGKLVKPFMHVQHEVSDAAAAEQLLKISIKSIIAQRTNLMHQVDEALLKNIFSCLKGSFIGTLM